MGTTQRQFSLTLHLNLTLGVSVFVFILWISARLQSDTVFGEPSLRPIELSQPPVFPLLQHANEVTLWEAQQRSDDVTCTGGEVGVSFRGGWPWGDSSSQQRDRGLRRDIRRAAGFLNGANHLLNHDKISLSMRYNLQMPDLLTLMLSIGRWRPVNVWVTHREADRGKL